MRSARFYFFICFLLLPASCQKARQAEEVLLIIGTPCPSTRSLDPPEEPSGAKVRRKGQNPGLQLPQGLCRQGLPVCGLFRQQGRDRRHPFKAIKGFPPNCRTGMSILCATLRVSVNGPRISDTRSRRYRFYAPTMGVDVRLFGEKENLTSP